jgi:FAD/FMN-containing dehydrogenase
LERAWESEADYYTRSANLAAAVLEAATRRAPIGLHKTTSNLFRQRHDSSKYKLDVRDLNRVLRICPETMTADVEGMTTYETLVNETLKYDLLPAVVPELKTITIGGAVSGLGIESSSFRYGLVHDGLQEMDVLTGDGRILICSACKNPDLFVGFPNSYGTFGYALRLRIKLIAAEAYVRITHSRFTNAWDFFDEMGRLCRQNNLDYLDGTIFSKDEMYISRGEFCRGAPKVSDYTRMQIYYRSIPRKGEDWLTARDYIWRWDTDWFWCSRHFGAENPVMRYFARAALNSKTYQRLMRASQTLLPATSSMESVIQDVQIPIEHGVEFLEFILAQTGITPIWVCPFLSSSRKYDFCAFERSRLYLNFGFWDRIPAPRGSESHVKSIEQKITELGGTKGLYSTSCYDRDTFWGLYNKPRYDELKRSYDPQGLFPDLYDKCVGRT